MGITRISDAAFSGETVIYMKKSVVLRLIVALLLLLSLFATSCRGNRRLDGESAKNVDSSAKGNGGEGNETDDYGDDRQFDYDDGEAIEFPEIPIED